jgi:hypothetical protein
MEPAVVLVRGWIPPVDNVRMRIVVLLKTNAPHRVNRSRETQHWELTMRKQGDPESHLHRLLRRHCYLGPRTTAVPGCHAIQTGIAAGLAHPCGSYCFGKPPDYPMLSSGKEIFPSNKESDLGQPTTTQSSSTCSASPAMTLTALQGPHHSACHRASRSPLVLRYIGAQRRHPQSS